MHRETFGAHQAWMKLCRMSLWVLLGNYTGYGLHAESLLTITAILLSPFQHAKLAINFSDPKLTCSFISIWQCNSDQRSKLQHESSGRTLAFGRRSRHHVTTR